ncbi:MAG TPA: DUF1622 domain-containing protein [Anaeromyxobacteraceae bacterium]|nr:DUF1622 domain-containing protein [Anaeromyxobacteraceae bacterium]
MGAGVVTLGGVRGIAALADRLAAGGERGFGAVRRILARHLSRALGFQLPADMLSTAIAPSRDRLGVRGAIVFVRTGRDHFLA